ncbi:MAG TPA: hypothetical protein VH253_13525 [Phycisphaerae bacterium]|nr:hypothetical protein [Phycisphaerae bacterium]
MTDEEAEAERRWHERKSALMEEMLGKEHNRVMHAIVSYAIGGGLDLYYYPNGIQGTAIATKELSERAGEGSSNRVFRCYELVMFTKQPLDLAAAKDASTPFGRAHMSINAILNRIARYSARAKLNPKETCEFPAEMARVGGKCLIFDGYPSCAEGKLAEFGLLAVIEVFRSEMEHARKHGGAMLLKRLQEQGHYPYSDLDRGPVA